jgi:hypothetical protein
MDNKDRVFSVTNRSASRVHYELPEIGIKARVFEPGETKRNIKYAELEALTYIPGGMELIKEYLQVKDESVREELVGDVEPEYHMDNEAVKKLILEGSMDEWLDALDFAPDGVIDLIKEFSAELPLTDTRKMQAFQEKKGVNLANMIQLRQEEIREERESAAATATDRRVAPASEAPKEEAPSKRRTTGSKYKVVKKGTTE